MSHETIDRHKTDEQVAKLADLLDKLCDALFRRGTEQDGNWGWPKFTDEVQEIRDQISNIKAGFVAGDLNAAILDRGKVWLTVIRPSEPQSGR